MSRGAEIELHCWDGTYSFRLRLGELRQLQEKCDAGPAFILSRLRDGSWRVDDIRETLRLGLIGAGMDQKAALRSIESHVDGVPLDQNIVTAHAVIGAAIYGAPDEKPGKATPANQTTGQSSNEASSGSPASMQAGS